MKFGMLMQNEMQMTINRVKIKLEVEFQYGVFLFPKTGNCSTLIYLIKIWSTNRF